MYHASVVVRRPLFIGAFVNSFYKVNGKPSQVEAAGVQPDMMLEACASPPRRGGAVASLCHVDCLTSLL